MITSQFLLVSAISFLAGLVQGLSGFGSALVAMPLLLLFMPAKTATPFCLLMGIFITMILSLKMKRHLDWKRITPLILGCLPGIPVGLYILKNADDRFIKLFLGLLLMGYSTFQLGVRPAARHLSRSWGLLAGFLTGMIGAAFSAGGPPTIIYVTLNDWNKDEIKATLTGFFLITGSLAAAGQALAGITTTYVLKLFLLSTPLIAAGTLAGAWLYRRMSHQGYLRSIYLLLIAMGIMMLADALSHY